MGTSSSYGGPTGTNPLLPDWAQPDAPDESSPQDGEGTPESEKDSENTSPQPDAQPQVNFRGAKSSMTQWVNGGGGGGRSGVGRVGRNYVRARGGAGGSATAARSGRTSTARLGSFLSTVARDGLAAAAREAGLGDLTGRPAAEVFAAIANRLTPSGSTLEEAAARRAVDEALQSLYVQYDLANQDISALEQMDADTVRGAIKESVSEYIYQRWLQELGDRLEENAVSAQEAVRLEREVREYVSQTVQLDLQDVDVLNTDWAGQQGSGVVERIYQEAYGFLE